MVLKAPLVIRLGKKHFFVNSEILGILIWQKKRVNYNKFEIATIQRKSLAAPPASKWALQGADMVTGHRIHLQLMAIQPY